MASQPPPPPVAMPAPAPPPAKKTSPWVWVAVGCGGVLLLVLLIFLIGGYFVAKKVGNFAKEAEKNPAMAAAKMIAAVTPDIEVVEADDKRNTITLRNTKTGEVVTMDVNDVKEGRIKFKTDKGEAEISGDRGGGVTIRTEEGTATFGTGDDYPGWLPSYPGASPVALFASRTENESMGTWQFTTADDAAKVVSFFQRELKERGFKITSTTSWQADEGNAGMVMAEDGKRNVMVTVAPHEGRTQVNVAVQN